MLQENGQKYIRKQLIDSKYNSSETLKEFLSKYGAFDSRLHFNLLNLQNKG